MLAEVLNRAANEFPDRIAYVSAEGWGATFRQLDQFSDECAVWLSTRAGVREGDVVSLVMPSTIEYIVLFGALAKLGATIAGVNSLLTARTCRCTRVCAAEPGHRRSRAERRIAVRRARARDRQRRQCRRHGALDAGAQRSAAGAAARSAARVHDLLHVRFDGHAQGRVVPRSADPRDRRVGHRRQRRVGPRHAQHRVDAIRARRRHDQDPVDAGERRHHSPDDAVAGPDGDAVDPQVPHARAQRWADTDRAHAAPTRLRSATTSVR